MAKVGYMRVSTVEQNLSRQLKQLEGFGCKKIFSEKVSGKDIKSREELNKLLDFIREDDEVVVISLDRLSRNSDDIDYILSIIKSKGAFLTILDMPSFNGVEDLNLKKLLNNLMIEIFKYTAQNEREVLKERQRQGIEIAKKEGKYKGTKPKYRADTNNKKDKYIFEEVIRKLNEKESILKISQDLGLSRNTVKAIKQRENI